LIAPIQTTGEKTYNQIKFNPGAEEFINKYTPDVAEISQSNNES